MAVKIIGLIIGILVLGAGVYYLAKEKHDPESKKIYTVVSAIGAVIAAVCAVLLFVEFNRSASNGTKNAVFRRRIPKRNTASFCAFI